MSRTSADQRSPSSPASRFRKNWRGISLIVISLSIGLVFWEAATRLTSLPSFMLPAPAMVWESFWMVFGNGTLLRHTLYTLLEVLTGLALGVTLASITGYFLAKFPTIEKLLSPYVVASQAIPIVAIAPLLIIWFGPGLTSKILICALIVFFPVLINTIVGLQSVPEDLHDLMRSLQATKRQTFWLLEVPASLPIFLGGLRVGATLAVIGAVVGEFVGADRGLGFLVNRARAEYDTALVFVAIFTLVALALSMYGIVTLLERRLLAWRQRPEHEILAGQ
jgi:NitT/TauT family transport system permease protein